VSKNIGYVNKEGSPVEEIGSQGGTLLLVDDEVNVLKSLSRLFADEPYRTMTASGGDEALAILERERVHVVLSDNRMPGMTGTELFQRVKKRWPQVIRIMVTGFADVQAIMEAVNEGAIYKFITKPWNDDDIKLSVRLALQQYQLVEENKRLTALAREQQEKISKYAAVLNENRGAIGLYLL